MGPHEGMYRGAIANEKNDLQLARLKDPFITDRHSDTRLPYAPHHAPEQVQSYRSRHTASKTQEKQPIPLNSFRNGWLGVCWVG